MKTFEFVVLVLPFDKSTLVFFYRYRVVSDKTWPKWSSGDFKKGCEEIMQSLGLTLKESGSGGEEIAWGVTKIFIKHPEIIFSLEEKRDQRVWGYALKIQDFFKTHVGRHKFYHGIQMKGHELLKSGGKERRRLSFERNFKTDYCWFKDNKTLQSIIERYGEDRSLFSEAVWVYTVKGTRSKRTLVLTSAAIYFFGLTQRQRQGQGKGQKAVVVSSDDFFYSIARRITIESISGISCSKKSDNFFVIHVTGQHSHVVQGRRKTELFATLNMLVTDKIPIKFEDKIPTIFKDEKKNKILQKSVSFSTQAGAVDGGVLDPKTFAVSADAGLPSSNVPNFKGASNSRGGRR